MSENIFFDMDGTLIDSASGIIDSMAKAYKACGFEVPSDALLRKFIGPPLVESAEKYTDIWQGSEESKKLLHSFQDYYGSEGWKDITLYSGMEETLKNLVGNEKHLFITTAKPQKFADETVEYLGIGHFFEGVYGSDIEETLRKKDIIATCVKENHLENEIPETVMVGDRNTDVDGATANNIATVGVLYGFGTAKELKKAGAKSLVKRPQDLVAEVEKY